MSHNNIVCARAVAIWLGVAILTITGVRAQELKKPAPVALLSKVYFKDTFDGDKLANHWEVVNPDPDQFVVENGELLIIAKAVGGLTTAETPNLFRLKRDLPNGDWVVTIKFKAELQTTKDLLEFGLFTDAENYILTRFWGTCCYSELHVEIKKRSGGTNTNFNKRVWKLDTYNYQAFANTVPQPITIKLIKEGRTYRSAIHFDGQKNDAGEPIWVETELVSSLRPPKQFVLNAAQWEAVSGESLFMIDSIQIETPEK
ncbi:MAG: hypothetical protein ABFS45_19605 [Pseudomonadota bacterium]